MKKTAVLSVGLLLLTAALSPAATRFVPAQYSAIQAAINDCNDGDMVIVHPGIYTENINFNGMNVVVTSTNPDDPNVVAATVINGYGENSVVTFANGEGPEAVLTGFTITGGYGTVDPSIGDFAYWGAGIYCYQASPTITANVITGNNGPTEIVGDDTGYGGAIACQQSGAIITRNIIRDNSAFAGAGIMVYLGSPRISSNLIYGNSAWYGGGVCLLDGGQLINNTIVANDATIDVDPGIGGNVYAESDIELECLILNNMICSAQNGGGIYYYTGSTEYDNIAYNNVWGNVGGQYVDWPDQTGNNGNITQDPMFVSPLVNDYHLQSGSPCISAGAPSFVPIPGETDIDGDPRVFAIRVDIGADEYIGYIKPIADAGPDQHVKQIQLITLDASASFICDPCGVVTFEWEQIAGPSVVLSDPTAMQPAFMPQADGEYRFELVVSDGLNTSEPDEVVVTVGNQPPVADAGPDKVCNVPGQVTLDSTGSYDPDPLDEITYNWTQLEGPNVVLYDAETATPYFDCNEQGLYVFQLVVNDGLDDSEPSLVQVVTVAVTLNQQELSVGYNTSDYFHYPDVSGSKVIYGVGSACDFTWDLKCKDLQTGQVKSFTGGGIDTQPKIDGDITVWFGGPYYQSPWGHEPSNTSIFVRNIVTKVQQTLRQYTWSESYSHPVVSGNKVVWLEHLNLDTEPIGSSSANNWYDTPYNICGADINDLYNPVYFTIAENVGSRDPYPCYTYSSDFDDVIDICGDLVVWEADGDIFGADISDISNIEVFPICQDPARQFDPAVSGSLVVWTDERNDSGDIYGADISDINDVREMVIIKKSGGQQQPAIDGPTIVYVDGGLFGEIKVCCPTKRYGVLDIPLSDSPYGMGPAIDGDIIVWQDDYYGRARGIFLQLSYSIADGPVENLTTEKRYDYIQHAINAAAPGDQLVADEEIYHENINFKGKNLTVRSAEPSEPSVVAVTVINGGKRAVTFANGEDVDCILSGFTITGAKCGVYCSDTTPTIANCNIVGNTDAGVVSCYGAGANPTIVNCTIVDNTGGGIELWLTGRTPSKATVINCTIAQNMQSGISGGITTTTNSIIWGNSPQQIAAQPEKAVVTYSDIQGGWPGLGNIDTDPCFVAPAYWDTNGTPNDVNDDLWVDGDYYLRSEGWRWDSVPGRWCYDYVTSRCIDAGNPGSPLGEEFLFVPDDPNNDWGQNLRINMGAYGGTTHASMPPYDWTVLADLTNDGTADFVDLAYWAENWLSSASQSPADLDRNGVVNMVDFALLARDYFTETTWHE